MSRLNTMYPNDEFLKDISNVIGKVDSKNETQIKKEIEQVGYKEFYRYYKEKDIYIKQLQQENQKYKEVINKAIEYLTSYSSIHTIQFGTENDSLNDIELNKTLDEKTLNEMTNRYLKVHDKLLEILKEVE